MIDITVVGGGSSARMCGEVLAKAGFEVHNTLEIEAGERTPIILGETPAAFALARQAVDSGRHMLIASPLNLPPERLSLLLESRKRSQALFVWNERRHHPGYRFVNGLMEADATWRPRYIRQESLSLESTSSGLMRWRTLESLALVMGLTDEPPVTAASVSAENAVRNAADLLSFNLSFRGLDAFFNIGLGEAIERRETLIASSQRKAFVDELNPGMPVRLVEDEPRRHPSGVARWLSCAQPTVEEMARQQCLTFLDATLKASLAQEEASVWLRSIGSLDAIERSLHADGATTEISVREETPRFRLILGRSFANSPPSVA